LRGDHIKVFRYFYFHHAIDMGDGTCIHFTGEPFKKFDSYIQHTDMRVFLKGGKAKVVKYRECKDADEVINTALSYVGQAGYHLIWNNCYHFARFCKTGQPMPRKFHELNQKAASWVGFNPILIGPSRCEPHFVLRGLPAQLHAAGEALRHFNLYIKNKIIDRLSFK
jgi:hypothetical protein